MVINLKTTKARLAEQKRIFAIIDKIAENKSIEVQNALELVKLKILDSNSF